MILAVLATVAALTGSEAFAQIRPALMKNVDEPGRTPFETRSQVLPGSGCFAVSDCFAYSTIGNSITFDLRPVPVGKRWIVQSATGGLTSTQGKNINIELRNNRGGLVFDGAKWLFGGPFLNGNAFDSLIYNANLFAVFGPGETPTVRVTVDPSLGGYFVIVFSGYLIDASN
jgi:hypothetical protein